MQPNRPPQAPTQEKSKHTLHRDGDADVRNNFARENPNWKQPVVRQLVKEGAQRGELRRQSVPRHGKGRTSGVCGGGGGGAGPLDHGTDSVWVGAGGWGRSCPAFQPRAVQAEVWAPSC